MLKKLINSDLSWQSCTHTYYLGKMPFIYYSFQIKFSPFQAFISCGTQMSHNKNTLIAASRLACLEIRSRNEEAINSTRNIFYSLRVSYFLLYRRRYFLFLNWFSTRVSDDQKYLSGSRLYACINTRKFKGLDSREITSLPDIEKVIYMARHFNHHRK